MNLIYIDIFLYVLFAVLSQYNSTKAVRASHGNLLLNTERTLVYGVFAFFIFSIVLQLIFSFPEPMLLFTMYAVYSQIKKMIYPTA